MQRFDLNGTWALSFADTHCTGSIPGSVYSFLLDAALMPDPYYRDNELAALQLMEHDFTFTRAFAADAAWCDGTPVLLRCEGLDTACTLVLNGTEVGRADNMHRTWEFDVTRALRPGENTLALTFASPTRILREAYDADPIGGSYHAMRGFPHIRKAHCMYGWDWGPRLPDAGIWRDISLLRLDSPRIADVHIRQQHQTNADGLPVAVSVTAHVCVTEPTDRRFACGVPPCDAQPACCAPADDTQVRVTLTAPDGTVLHAQAGQPCAVPNPQLWWPNGYGAQPLYTVHVALVQNGQVVDATERRIGLRTMTVVREKDAWGESFDQCVNGLRMFAMGADYIPEDNLLARVTPARTFKLLEQCVAANFNSVRVWGGGYYPDDWFYDACDELGLVVWQDFMFACANYHLTPAFERSIRAEFWDNVRRLRHHASLGLWCGNNEMEMFQAMGEYQGTHQTRADYIRMFEHVLPEVLRDADPDTFYWPASPSSGGGFDAPNDPNRGDVHYWDVWHGRKPFADYRNYFFRYASEFGFQAFPCAKTVESFTLPEDRNIFSRVMEMHQRNEGANGKIMDYLSQTYLYPTSFDALLYASQLLQAEAIRFGVEHWRRNRGRCMGAIYWQLNDIWPVASWASIDSLGRWKALHYYARRFFAPLMLSCHETGETTDRISVVMEPSPIQTTARLCVANETRQAVIGTVRWALRGADGAPLTAPCLRAQTALTAPALPETAYPTQGAQTVTLPALTSVWLDALDFPNLDFLNAYLSFALEVDGQVVSSGTSLFTAPKHFHFRDPQLTCTRQGDTLTVRAAAFARSVEISSPDSDLVLSDNYFDLNGGEATVRILEGDPQTLCVRSVFDIR